MRTGAKITNIVLDSNNANEKNAKNLGAMAMKRKPYPGKVYYSPIIVPIENQKAEEQPLQLFHTSYEQKKTINLPNGSKTTKSVYAKPNDLKVDNNVIKHQDQPPKFINAKKPNLSKNKRLLESDPLTRYNRKFRKDLQHSAWKVGDAQWKPKTLLPYLQPTFTVILGDSKGKKNYFRAFTTTISKPVDKKDRAARLLPHRMRKTMRLYGVSPLVLLKKSKFRTGVPGKAEAGGLASKENLNQKTAGKIKLETEDKTISINLKQLAFNDRRVNGPEIAPNFSEDNEFDVVDFDFESKNIPIAENKDKTRENVVENIILPSLPTSNDDDI